MSRPSLFEPSELPLGFVYPRQFEHIVELGLTNLEPWHILEGTALRRAAEGLRLRFPERKLIPFAHRQDNDDIACWQAGQGDGVFIVHDFASPGWEHRGYHQTFWDWFRQAIEDLIEFEC